METIYLNRKNLRYWQEQAKPKVIALGYFDGLHHGHCKVIQTALQKAKEKNLSLTVMSFYPHPKTILSGGKERVHELMPLSEKEKKLRNLGVDTFYIVEFDKSFAALPPDQFVADYLVQLGVVHAVAGFDFSYGGQGAGHMDRLKADSGGLIDVTKVAKVECHGEKISSTRIRKNLLSGNVEELPQFLGHFYEVKCDWDGGRFKLHPDYTLPAPGCYAVTLKNEISSLETELTVMDQQQGPSLKCMEKIPSFMEGRLSIVWHRHLRKDHVHTFEEKALIY
ncbi:adenylyltransferase/cytidyltransferase family protein [Ammoniphilus sp. 3BR4]|uniref:adenylyltransferase/cytidyltransferase family protein n=1 Tax=Ammoniphilus sp. 3BR4 TaxID=3158265 RepID=UPI0034661055